MNSAWMARRVGGKEASSSRAGMTTEKRVRGEDGEDAEDVEDTEDVEDWGDAEDGGISMGR